MVPDEPEEPDDPDAPEELDDPDDDPDDDPPLHVDTSVPELHLGVICDALHDETFVPVHVLDDEQVHVEPL